jgi:SAM-dependent methyltransferase
MTTTPPVCDYEGSDYQTSFWEQGGRAYEDRAEEIALRRLVPTQGTLLLELGAGAGRNTPRYPGYERIVLLDYSRTQLQQARAKLGDSPRYIYIAADIYRLPFRAALFDGATMIRTLHHMADAPAALAQVRRVLAPGATFILEYANKLNVKAILRYWLGRQNWSPFSPEPVEFVKLNFDFHPAAIRRWLAELGFIPQKTLTVSHFRLGLLKRWLPAGFLAALDGLAQLTGDWWQITPSVFIKSTLPAAAAGEPRPASVLDWFQCPACGQTPLHSQDDALHCSGCGQNWAYRDGIYDFRDPLSA